MEFYIKQDIKICIKNIVFVSYVRILTPWKFPPIVTRVSILFYPFSHSRSVERLVRRRHTGTPPTGYSDFELKTEFLLLLSKMVRW